MRTAMLKIAILALFVAAMIGAPALSCADDTTPTTSPSTKPEATAATKFYGTVTAVDTTGMTFSISEQTFTITADSKMTKDNKPATLADAVVGEPARGSYVEGSDGKLNVTRVRFGKKPGGKGGGKSGGKHKNNAATQTGATTQPADSQ